MNTIQFLSDDQVEVAVVRAMPRIQKLVAQNLRQRYQSKFDTEDIMQTVVRTIVRKIRANKFSYDFEDEDQLWKVITTIVIRRLLCKIRYLHAERRSISRELSIEGWDGQSTERNPYSGELSDILDSDNANLTESENRVLLSWLDGKSKDEIARRDNCSVRTVTRRLNRVIAKMKQVAATLDWGDD